MKRETTAVSAIIWAVMGAGWGAWVTACERSAIRNLPESTPSSTERVKDGGNTTLASSTPQRVDAGSGAHHAADISIPWGTKLDWDGDGSVDTLGFDYTGGAHCCYHVRIDFGNSTQSIRLPFDLDGGYVGGQGPGSDPKRVRIEQRGALPELIVEIATYNGKPGTIPREWTEKYGVTTHYVAIGFGGRRVTGRNWGN